MNQPACTGCRYFKSLSRCCTQGWEWVPEGGPHRCWPTATRKGWTLAAGAVPPGLLGVLRQRRGLDKDDSSQDDVIAKLTPRQMVEEVCTWFSGSPAWASDISRWMREAGVQPKDFC